MGTISYTVCYGLLCAVSTAMCMLCRGHYWFIYCMLCTAACFVPWELPLHILYTVYCHIFDAMDTAALCQGHCHFIYSMLCIATSFVPLPLLFVYILYAVNCWMFVPGTLVIYILYAVYCRMFVLWGLLLHILYDVCHVHCCFIYCMLWSATYFYGHSCSISCKLCTDAFLGYGYWYYVDYILCTALCHGHHCFEPWAMLLHTLHAMYYDMFCALGIVACVYCVLLYVCAVGNAVLCACML